MSQLKLLLKFLLLTSLLLFPCPLLFAANDFKVQISSSVRQGEILALKFEGESVKNNGSIHFLEKRIPCYLKEKTSLECFIGIPADAVTGKQSATIVLNRSTQSVHSTEILPYPFPIETLNLTEEKKSLLTKKGREAELIKIKEALGTESEIQFWEEKFIQPVQGRIESLYGEKRKLDGKLLAGYHRGLDIGAPQGAPIKSANHGEVILAGHFIEEGNMVMVDHGQGIITAYLHLSKILVKKGDQIRKGEIIGNVGSTGISNSPHLHFGTYIHSVPIDPLYLLRFY